MSVPSVGFPVLEPAVTEAFSSLGPGAPQVATVLVGLVVLLLGRKLFWLFVAAVGFTGGLYLAVQLLSRQPDWLVLLAALAVGLIGAVVAIFVQRIAVALAGFGAGGFALLWLVRQFELTGGDWSWLIFIAGGIIGAILVITLFEIALVILSSLAGATMVLQAASLSGMVALLLFGLMIVIGIAVQARMLRQESDRHD